MQVGRVAVSGRVRTSKTAPLHEPQGRGTRNFNPEAAPSTKGLATRLGTDGPLGKFFVARGPTARGVA